MLGTAPLFMLALHAPNTLSTRAHFIRIDNVEARDQRAFCCVSNVNIIFDADVRALIGAMYRDYPRPPHEPFRIPDDKCCNTVTTMKPRMLLPKTTPE